MNSSKIQRRLAHFWLVVFLAALFCDGYHRSAQEHAPCPVDGELAHADEPGGHAHAEHAFDPPAPRKQRAGERAPTWTPGVPEADLDHAHCGLFVLSLTEGCQTEAPTNVALASDAAPRVRVVPGALAHPAIAPIALAPKQSPPRAL